ncbi:MAG: hypothetical protein QNJ20_16305 [Paracoccaceae bacterium]|nr:hypothetical protein [Paracoccaceae bacterium]
MKISKITEYARALYDAHGDKAELEAARKAKECEDAGDTAEAETWRAVRRAIAEIRGPHAS